MDKTETTIWAAMVTLLLLYALAYTTLSVLDEEHCRAQGAEYWGTSWSLEGYCCVSGVKVPAGLVRRD